MADPLLAGVPERYLIDGVEQTERVLGRGAYGVVFEGQWRGTKVAIKRHYYVLVRDENGQLSSPYRRFLEEFPVLKELPHPNIVQVFGMVPPTFPQDTPGLVMEYLRQTLRKRYAESPQLSRLDEATVSLGVVSALDYLHSRNVVHRDLTTNNIMVCDAAGTGGEVKAKITDVGGAAIMADGAQVESMSLNPGAQIYMAPETQRSSRRNGNARYGPPADCYSCALSVMAMCNRREPPDIFTVQQEGRAVDLESLGEDHPLHSIIVRCLEADPSLRPTAAQLCSEISEVQLRLKAAPVEKTTLGAAAGNTCHGHPADNPELVAARADIASLLQAMSTLDGQRDDLLRERDELLADRDSFAADNANLQRAVTEAGTEREELMRDLIAEQDRLTVEIVRLRQSGDVLQQDLSRARQPEGRQPLAQPRQQADLLEFIATQNGDMAMLARCSLIRPPALDHLNPATLPKWVAVGAFPACRGTSVMVCVCHGRLYLETLSGTYQVHAISAPLHDLSKDNWTEIGLPPGSATEGDFVHQDIFSNKGELYIVSTAPDVTLPKTIWKRNDLESRWDKITEMPQQRHMFSSSVVDDCLVIAGGSSSSTHYARALPDVISLNLVEDGADWVAWRDWPSPSSAQVRVFPNITATSGQVHIIGGELEGKNTAAVFTADRFSPPQERFWSTDTIPSPPNPMCAAVVANDHLVICGGSSWIGKSSSCYVYSAVSKSWLPLPDIQTKYVKKLWRSTLISTDQGILTISGHDIAGLRW